MKKKKDNKKIFKMPVKPIKIKPLSPKSKPFDIDRDGVPDWKDCQPLNPWKQHKDKGDWMETKEQHPSIYGQQSDWMQTKRYKRRPKTETQYHPYELEIEAKKRYGTWDDLDLVVHNSASAYLAPQMGLAPSNWQPDISSRDIQIYPYRQDTLRLYDRNTNVYHYVDISNPQEYEPQRLFSITGEDKQRISDKKIKKYFEE